MLSLLNNVYFIFDQNINIQYKVINCNRSLLIKSTNGDLYSR